jgi:hypothetical protein
MTVRRSTNSGATDPVILTAVPLTEAAARSGLTVADILGLLAAPGEDQTDPIVRKYAGDAGLLVSLDDVLQVAPAIHAVDRMTEAELVAALSELDESLRTRKDP